eukprot:CAMPEP_0176445456 /NCGR_PEP_ID=MMETSP0127-20121128/23710_1 /TAXON_ID=938130 /ORGANISM="Platyophrya macrostoma, Strain WH" /LENGTH=279 /DNA_ID=CAMNT_0017831241 /DNA_START=43 /DNA_END=882 /DNA_ORIENTATION=+
MAYLEKLKTGGFSFDNHPRNSKLIEKKILPEPNTTKTGTTICGVVYDGGVVLAADTRATGGSIVFDKNCEKIHYIAPNIYACGAGTAADCEMVTLKMSSELELMRLNTGRQSRVSTMATRLCAELHRYQGYIGTALIIGGVDVKGAHICSISPYGTSDYLPYIAMGSGSLDAMAIMEDRYKDNLTLEEAKALVMEAIEAGITHDLGSGNNLDVCVITKAGAEMFRNIKVVGKRVSSEAKNYKFPIGDSLVYKTLEFKKEKVEMVIESAPKKEDKMDIVG